MTLHLKKSVPSVKSVVNFCAFGSIHKNDPLLFDAATRAVEEDDGITHFGLDHAQLALVEAGALGKVSDEFIELDGVAQVDAGAVPFGSLDCVVR